MNHTWKSWGRKGGVCGGGSFSFLLPIPSLCEVVFGSAWSFSVTAVFTRKTLRGRRAERKGVIYPSTGRRMCSYEYMSIAAMAIILDR